MEESGHVVWMIGLYLVTMSLYATEVVLASLNGIGATEIFINTVGNVSDMFYLEITPASWTFSIWGFIYAWQVLWILYALTLICRRGKSGYLYANPQVLPTGLLVFFNLSTAFVIAWLFVWDRLLVHAAFATLVLATASSHAALVSGHRQLERIKSSLVDQGQGKEIWLVRVLVLNGVAFYNTWVSIATCLNFAMVMTYAGPHPLPQKAASTAALGLLMAIIFTWFILKNFLFEKYLRFTYSPFIVLPVGLIGSISKNWDRDSGNSVLTAMLLSLVGVLFVISVVHTIVRQVRENKRTSPLMNDHESVSSDTKLS